MKKRKISKFQLYLVLNSLILVGTTTVLTLLITKHDILPTKYLILALSLGILIPLLIIFFMLKKKTKKIIKIILSVISILIIGAYAVGSIYIKKTYNFIEEIIDDGYVIENYSVITLKNSEYTELSLLDSKKIGYFKSESPAVPQALDQIKENIQFTEKEYNDQSKLIEGLYNKKTEGIIIEESYRPIIEETTPDFSENTQVVYKMEIKRKKDEIVKNVDVKNEAFNIYISGIDTYGNIASLSRSDVNIVATINPQTHQMLLVSIPRDYYVQLAGTEGSYKDKLTHAGIYGVDKSVKTIENLLDIDINYYIKVNFSSVEKIIDTLGGVDVYSQYTFIGYENSTFKKGFNRVNGKQGLEFARTRKTVQGGDRTRGENQEALIQAMLNKATSKEIITKYTSILNSLNGSFQTNMPVDKITDLIKKQLNDMSKWTVTSISLDGYDARRYTYSYSGGQLYVMVPNEQSIEEAKQKINDVLDGEIFESSYIENSTGQVNIPQTIYVAPEPVEPPKEEPVKETEQIISEEPEEPNIPEETEQEELEDPPKEEPTDPESPETLPDEPPIENDPQELTQETPEQKIIE